MTSTLNPRLLQMIRCRRQAHFGSFNTTTWLPQATVTRLQYMCPLARTLMKNSHDSNSSIQDTCQWHRNVQKGSSCQSSLPQLNRIIKDSNQRGNCRRVPGFNLDSRRWFHCQTALMAGHSKWDNIKRAKGASDQARSLVFAKYAKLIRSSVIEGGSPNPELNSQLAYYIRVAKSKDMPKTSIENAIKSSNKPAVPSISLLYEVKGPGNCALMVDVMAENLNRTRQELNKLFKDTGVSLKSPGSNMYAFEKKGVVRVKHQSKEDQPPLTLDLATEVAIEVEAEEVEETMDEENEAVFMFICEPNQVKIVKEGLTAQSYMVESAGLEYIAVKDYQVEMSEANLEIVSKIIQRIEGQADVVKVYDNIA